MRTLNKSEQLLCARILAGNGNNNYLGNLIDHRLGGVRIAIRRAPIQVTLKLQVKSLPPSPEEQDKLLPRLMAVRDTIISTLSLLQLLEKEGYVFLVQNAHHIDDEKEFGQGVGNLPAVENPFADESLTKLLVDYSSKEIYVTESFREFCANRYIAKD